MEDGLRSSCFGGGLGGFEGGVVTGRIGGEPEEKDVVESGQVWV